MQRNSSSPVGADAALRAASLQIIVDQGAALEGGEKFSIGERAYRVVRPTAEDTFQIQPPLRAAAANDDAIEFDWPVVRCRMASDDFEGALSLGRVSQKSITFVESFSS
jgi:hypothetical protein